MTDDARTAYLEVWRPRGVDVVVLAGERTTLGRAPGNGVVLDHDHQVSSLHAVVEAYGSGWCVRDLGSTNGTTVGRERLIGERALRAGDEIRVGETRIVFRATAPDDVAVTTAPRRPPELTRRERDVLVALCRPLFRGAMFSEPASSKDIASALVVSEAAVKQHLMKLYDKFDLHDTTGRRRTELANEALRRGAVTPAELTG